MQKKKKGFTLVELLVVIAILAILASVSVVGYLSFTKKAQESNDVSLTDQMNTVLQANEALDKADTLGEAIKQIKEDGGVDLELITPNSKGYNYAWDKKQNRILLLNESNEVVAPANLKDEATEDTVIIVKTKEQLEKAVNANYGVGIASSYTEDITTFDLFKEVSLDNYAGKIKTLNVKSTAPATYSLERNTNSNVYYSGVFENITLDESNGVTVYGEATTLDVKKNTGITIAANINKVVVSEGNVNVIEKAVVDFVDASNASNSSKVTINKTGTAIVGGVQAPEGNKGAVDGNIGSDIVVDSTPVTDFAGGLGTETSPYLIENIDQFKKINKFSSDMKNSKAKCFKLLNDVTVEQKDIYNYNGDYAFIGDFCGHFNGNNKTITINAKNPLNSATAWLGIFYNTHAKNKGDVTKIENLKVIMPNFKEATCISLISNVGMNYDKGLVLVDNVEFKNSGNSVYKSWGNNMGLLGCFINTNIKVTNSRNYANVSIDGVSAVWLGAIFTENGLVSVVFENVHNFATVEGNEFGYFNGNNSYLDKYTKENISKYISVNNCYNYGTILKYNKKEINLFDASNNKNETFALNEMILNNFDKNGGYTKNIISTGNISLNIAQDGKINAIQSTDSTINEYKITLSTHYFSAKNGSNGGFRLEIYATKENIKYLYNADLLCVYNNNFDGYEILGTVPQNAFSSNFEITICKKDNKVYYAFNDINKVLVGLTEKDDDIKFGVTSKRVYAYANGQIKDYIDFK